MKGTLSHELAVPAAAGEVWAIYGSLRLGQLAVELIPEVIEKIELVAGDGGEGTVLRVTLPTGGSAESLTYKESFTQIDDEKLVKEAEVVEGGFLDLGFRLFRVRFEITEGMSVGSCVIKSTIDYDIEEGFEQNAGLVTTDGVAALAEAIGNYLTQGH